MTKKAIALAVKRHTPPTYAKGYRCKETGEYAPLQHWAKAFSDRFGCTVHTAKIAVIKAAKTGASYHGLTFVRVEKGGA